MRADQVAERVARLRVEYVRDFARLPAATRDIARLARMLSDTTFLLDWAETAATEEFESLIPPLVDLRDAMTEKLEVVEAAYRSNGRPVEERLIRTSAELLLARVRRSVGRASPSPPSMRLARMFAQRAEELLVWVEQVGLDAIPSLAAAQSLAKSALDGETTRSGGKLYRLAESERTAMWAQSLVTDRSAKVVRLPLARLLLEEAESYGLDELAARLDAKIQDVESVQAARSLSDAAGALVGAGEVLRYHWRAARKSVNEGAPIRPMRTAGFADRASELEWQLFDLARALSADTEVWTGVRLAQDLGVRLVRALRQLSRAAQD